MSRQPGGGGGRNGVGRAPFGGGRRNQLGWAEEGMESGRRAHCPGGQSDGNPGKPQGGRRLDVDRMMELAGRAVLAEDCAGIRNR